MPTLNFLNSLNSLFLDSHAIIYRFKMFVCGVVKYRYEVNFSARNEL